MEIRRIVTGHDAAGHATVLFDDVTGLPAADGRGGCIFWTTESFPVDNTGSVDTAVGTFGTTVPDGTIFRVVSYPPGRAGRLHRTDSIDYAVVLTARSSFTWTKRWST